jgi:hypothetical protein
VLRIAHEEAEQEQEVWRGFYHGLLPDSRSPTAPADSRVKAWIVQYHANKNFRSVLSAQGHLYADLTHDDADVLLVLHLAESPPPLEAPQDTDGATLPPSHPIRQLVRAAAWLVSHPPLAA